MSKISVSIVLYNTDRYELDNAIAACDNSSLAVDVYLIDNSPSDNLDYLKSCILYFFPNLANENTYMDNDMLK